MSFVLTLFLEGESILILYLLQYMSSFTLRILTSWLMFANPDGNIQVQGGKLALRGEFIFDAALTAKFNY